MAEKGPPAFLDPGTRTHFKVSEVARLFGVAVQTVHFWLKTGRILQSSRTSTRGNHLIPREELVRMLKDAGREAPGLWETRRLKVLVIDDAPLIREFAEAVSRSPLRPMDLRTAPNIEDGLLLAGQFCPDVILLDYSFGGNRLRGDQALTFIRSAKLIQKVKVIALAGDRRIAQRMLRAGADGILLKPFGLGEFRAAILATPITAIERDSTANQLLKSIEPTKGERAPSRP